MSGKDPLRLAILISGRGSNMVAIARACAEGRINARVAWRVSERAGVAGLDAARDLGIEARIVAWPGAAERVQFERDLEAALADARPDLIVLAGFMRILSEQFVAAHAGRILNIHPSLLPKYRGLHTHRRVLEAGDRGARRQRALRHRGARRRSGHSPVESRRAGRETPRTRCQRAFRRRST